MATERDQFRSVGQLPDSQGAVDTGGGQSPPVRADGDAPHRTAMTAQDTRAPLAVVAPDPYRTVVAARGQVPPVRGEGDAPHQAGAATEDTWPAATVDALDSHGAVLAGAGHALPVRAERHGPDLGVVAVQLDRAPLPSVFQIRTVPSLPPLATRRPSGLNATDLTGWSCPRRTAVALPSMASQIRTVWSRPPLATRRPSALTATEMTVRSWPRSTRGDPPVRGAPEADRAVHTAARDRSPVTAAGHRGRQAVVAVQQVGSAGVGGIPEPYRAVAAAAGQPLTVGADGVYAGWPAIENRNQLFEVRRYDATWWTIRYVGNPFFSDMYVAPNRTPNWGNPLFAKRSILTGNHLFRISPPDLLA